MWRNQQVTQVALFFNNHTISCIHVIVIIITIVIIIIIIIIIIYFLLTECEGRTGRILPEVFLLRTKRSKVSTRKTKTSQVEIIIV